MDQNLFRDVIGRFASGVTVISTRSHEVDFGTTASAVSSLSTEPPMLLACMNRSSETGRAIVAVQRFVVNILGEEQADLAQRFATKAPDKFTGVEIERNRLGLPMIARALGHLECRVSETATGGTHLVFLSHVEGARASEGSPLTYYRGRFGRFEDAAQEAAYKAVRRMVLNRALGAGSELQIDALAGELDIERPRVQYALMKLTADGLVVRGPDGWAVRPLDKRRAAEAIDARCAIQVAVADEIAGRISPGEIAELRRHAESACAAVGSDPPDLQALRLAGRAFHETFIGSLHNETLVEIYRRLRIDSIWLRMARGRYVSPHYLAVVTDACERGDAEAAKAALRRHAAEARVLVTDMIEQAGGVL